MQGTMPGTHVFLFYFPVSTPPPPITFLSFNNWSLSLSHQSAVCEPMKFNRHRKTHRFGIGHFLLLPLLLFHLLICRSTSPFPYSLRLHSNPPAERRHFSPGSANRKQRCWHNFFRLHTIPKRWNVSGLPFAIFFSFPCSSNAFTPLAPTSS